MMELMKDITFENLSAGHLNEVLEIERLSFTTPWSKFAFVHEIQFERSVFKVIRLGNKLVGYGGFWHALDEAHISNIAIHPDYRRRGLGKLLLTHLLEEAVARGAGKASLEVRHSNIAAQEMYKAFGFRVASIRKNYYLDDREDALVMWNDDIRAIVEAASEKQIQRGSN